MKRINLDFPALAMVLLFSETCWAYSVGGESGWQYRRPVTLSPTTPEADFQVKVELTTSDSVYSKAQSQGEDIRFTSDISGSGVLDYWIEDWNTSGTSVIWVEVSTSGTSTIYMYYGNPAASSASSVSATFSSGSFSDTFSDSSKIDTTDSFNIAVTDGDVEISTHTEETTLTATGDARVVRQDPNAVHGSETFLVLQQYASTGHQRSFIQFDISSIPPAVTVNDVDFQIYYYLYLAGNPSGQNTRAKRVIGAWSAATITWNNQPGSTTSDEVSLNMPGSYGWMNYDADTIVQSWISGASPNYGFLVKFNTEYPTSNRCPIFRSTDYGDDTYRPKLTVNWTEHETTAGLYSVLVPTDTGTRLAVGNQLSWNDSEPANTDIKYQIEYKTDGSWDLIPDSVLSGNSAGFDTSPVDISSVGTDYGQIRLRGSLSTSDVSTTPTCSDWSVTYYYREYASPEPVASLEAETLIELSYCNVKPLDHDVLFEWRTEAEVGTAGFNVLRAESPEGPWVRVNADLIASQGSSWGGASYTFADATREAGSVYWYSIEEVRASGGTERYAPQLVWDEGMTDADGDVMPDVWEQRLGIDTGSGEDANADADGDGATNLEEYLAGTSPVDAKDCPRLRIQREQEGGRLVLTWPGRAGRSYELVTAGNPAELLCGDPKLSSRTQATSNRLMRFECDEKGDRRIRFYRLIISPPR